MPPHEDHENHEEDPGDPEEQRRHAQDVPGNNREESRTFESKARLLVLVLQAASAGIHIAIFAGTVGQHLGWW